MNPPGPPHRLAIVIPAWRAKHFTAALASLRDQTDRRFSLYIGDDGSPDDLRSIVDATTAGLDVVYHRFPQNLGGTDLVAHWHRCIALTRDEPWIWLFSDDDIAEPDCVAAFYRHFEDNPASDATLLRFNVVIIDEHDQILRSPAPHRLRENAVELFTSMLTDRTRFWCAPDHIFPRASFVRSGGFINYPKALSSDRATWLLFASYGHVANLSAAGIRFRRHPEGTSSGRISLHRYDGSTSVIKFLEFGLDLVKQLAPAQAAPLRAAALEYFQRYLHISTATDNNRWLTYRRCRALARIVPAPYARLLRRHARHLLLFSLPGIEAFATWRRRR